MGRKKKGDGGRIDGNYLHSYIPGLNIQVLTAELGAVIFLPESNSYLKVPITTSV